MAFEEIRREKINMTNYEKAKTMFFRKYAQHVGRHSSTIAVVEGQCCEQHIFRYNEKLSSDVLL